MTPTEGLSLFRPAGEGPWRTDPRGLGLLGSLGQPSLDDAGERRRPRWQLVVAGIALSVSAVWLLVVVAGLFLGLPARTEAGPPASPVPQFPALEPTSGQTSAPPSDDPDPTASLAPGSPTGSLTGSPTATPTVTTGPGTTTTTSARATSRPATHATTRRPATSARPRTTPAATTPAPPRTTAPALDPKFRNCQQAIAAGYGPYYAGRDPEYVWYPDRDGNGVVCDRKRGRNNGDG